MRIIIVSIFLFVLGTLQFISCAQVSTNSTNSTNELECIGSLKPCQSGYYLVLYFNISDCLKCRTQVKEVQSALRTKFSLPIFIAVEGLKRRAVKEYSVKYNLDSVIPVHNLLPSNGTGLDPKVLIVENECVKKIIKLNQSNEDVVNEIKQFLPTNLGSLEEIKSKIICLDKNITFNHISRIDVMGDFCSMVDQDVNKLITYRLNHLGMTEVSISEESQNQIEKDLISNVNISTYSDFRNELVKNNINLINYYSTFIQGNIHNILAEFNYIVEKNKNLVLKKIPFIFQYNEEHGIEKSFPINTYNDSITVDFSSEFCMSQDLVAFKINRLFEEKILIGIFRLKNEVYHLESICEPFVPQEYYSGLMLSNVSIALKENKLFIGYSYYAVIVEYDLLTKKQLNYNVNTKYYVETDFKTTFTYTLLDMNCLKDGGVNGVFWDKGEYYMFIHDGLSQKTTPLELGSGISNNRFVFKIFNDIIYFIDNEIDDLQLNKISF